MTSQDLFRQSCARIPGGCSTAAKSPLRSPVSSGPYFATEAAGGRFTDSDGRLWLDFDMALSAAVLGYRATDIDDAVVKQIRKGFVFSIPSLLEGQVAERICARFPAVEAVRFCKDGSDATTAAARIVRCATGKSRIVIGAYHGWHDWSAVHYYGNLRQSAQELGIPPGVANDTVWLATETFDAFKVAIRSVDSIAGVMICPENWTERDVRLLSDYCQSTETPLIFDEIKSGIRYGPHGVGGQLGLCPDLICLGKSIANGYPLAVLGGKSSLMAFCTQINFSTTAASETASLAAALAVDDHLRSNLQWPPWHPACKGIMSRVTSFISRTPPEHRLIMTGYPGNFRIHQEGCSLRNDPFREVLLRTFDKHSIFSTGYIAPCAAHLEEDMQVLELALSEAITEWTESYS